MNTTLQIISIHSTARVETSFYGVHWDIMDDFNPLHREGGDSRSSNCWSSSWLFQSTPPRGWRPKDGYCGIWNILISIHSTARVETKAIRPHSKYVYISIHSTARVETDALTLANNSFDISIHSTARVETLNEAQRLP